MPNSHPACSLSRPAVGLLPLAPPARSTRADLLPLAPPAWSARRLPAPSRAAGQVRTGRPAPSRAAVLLPLASSVRSTRHRPACFLSRRRPGPRSPACSLARHRPGPRAVGLPAPSRVIGQVRARRRPSSPRPPAKLATLGAPRQPSSPPAKMEQGRAARAGAQQRGRAPWFPSFSFSLAHFFLTRPVWGNHVLVTEVNRDVPFSLPCQL
jgi:hypothetical protein